MPIGFLLIEGAEGWKPRRRNSDLPQHIFRAEKSLEKYQRIWRSMPGVTYKFEN